MRQERRQPRDPGVDQHRHAALGNRTDLGDGERAGIRCEGDRLGVEVAARDELRLVGEHQRIVGHRVRLAHEHQRGMAQLVEACADDLRLAAQAVRVLHAVVAHEMRAADRRAFEQCTVITRDVDLARLSAERVNARIERTVAAARGVDGQRANDQRRLEHRLEGEERVQRERGRRLRAVDEREAFLGAERERRDAGRKQRFAGGPTGAVDDELALADQRERHVRERREVAGCTDRPLLGHVRNQSRVVHGDQRIDDGLAHARGAARERGGLQREHQAHDRSRQRRADAGRMRAHEVELQRGHVGVADARAREPAEAGVETVHGLAAHERALHDVGAGANRGSRGRVERQRYPAGVDRL